MAGAWYPSDNCRDCGRGVVGRFGEWPAARCPSCEATYDRRRSFESRMRKDAAAQLFAMDIPDGEVAAQLGVSVERVRQLKAKIVPGEQERREAERAARLARREKVIAMLADPDGPSPAEIGRRVGLSPERVRQIRNMVT